MTQKPEVGILMGSDSDYPIMLEAARVLKDFGVPFEMTVSSAHRSPEQDLTLRPRGRKPGHPRYHRRRRSRRSFGGSDGSGNSAPVVAVPIDSSVLKGLDALLATVQMPAGIPVATMAIGKAGARNAGLFAIQILALESPILAKKYAAPSERKWLTLLKPNPRPSRNALTRIWAEVP